MNIKRSEISRIVHKLKKEGLISSTSSRTYKRGIRSEDINSICSISKNEWIRFNDTDLKIFFCDSYGTLFYDTEEGYENHIKLDLYLMEDRIHQLTIIWYNGELDNDEKFISLKNNLYCCSIHYKVLTSRQVQIKVEFESKI